jgi:hypothetical protein
MEREVPILLPGLIKLGVKCLNLNLSCKFRFDPYVQIHGSDFTHSHRGNQQHM